jgi:hypothetical protein
MTVENLKINGRFGVENNEIARKQALARRATVDSNALRERQTMAKDSFLAFGHTESTETREAVASASHPFTD